jgi:hypothetical protein
MHEYEIALFDYEQALAIYSRLLQHQESPFRSGTSLIDCTIRCASAHRGMLALEKSVSGYTDAIRLCRRFDLCPPGPAKARLLTRAHFNRGIALAMQGEFSLSIEDLHSAWWHLNQCVIP